MIDFRHELVLPNDDLPFKMFVFEGKNGSYKVSKHWHRSVEIFYVMKGSIRFYIDSQLYTLNPGQFALVNSNEVHSVDCPDPNFTVVLQIPQGLFEKYLGDAGSLLFSHSRMEDERLAGLIWHMYEEYENKKYGYLLDILGSFYQLLYLLVTEYRVLEIDEERKKQHRNLDKLSHITNYIQVNYREDLTLEGVARIFGFSPAYLSRMFQKYVGINYKSYVLELRTEAGYRLLMNTDRPVGEIAVTCGFPDSRSFAKAFRKRYGMLPTEYRKSSGSKEADENDM